MFSLSHDMSIITEAKSIVNILFLLVTVNLSASQSLTQRLAVSLALDGRITLDAASQAGIVGIGEHQVSHASLGGNPLVGVERSRAQQLQFAGSRHVEQVKAGTVTSGQLDSQCRRPVASLLRAD
jgi:hypothetical protein